MSDRLKHYGVKGMKWGVRRYQNKDGSRKPAGKKREPKRVSTKTLRKERDAIRETEGKKIRSKYRDELQKESEKIREFGQKHNLDLDDGGGGSSSKGAEYMAKWDKFEQRQNEIVREIGKATNDQLIKKYGESSIDRIEKGDRRQVQKIMVGMLALPVSAIGLAVYGDMR